MTHWVGLLAGVAVSVWSAGAWAQLEGGVVGEETTAAPAAPATRPAAAAAECMPPCRAGFMCHQGQCISRCNPPCASHETCTDQGACVANPAAAPPSALPPPAAPPAAQHALADPGWASGASAYGWVSAVIIAAMTTVIVIADDSEIGIPVGGALFDRDLIDIVVEVVGANDVGTEGPPDTDLALEAMGAVGWKANRDWWVYAGGGPGLVEDGLGTPDWRVFVGARWAPIRTPAELTVKAPQ